jgi:UDP-N-acetylmuramate: L-alanyl-gamma-D-glutamyl-meso-diaminopimelate ligase
MEKHQPLQKSVHILGICGTFMAGVALLASEKGYRVSGQDANVYPPMSTQLEKSGITLTSGYSVNPSNLTSDNYIIGNALSRGKFPIVEEILNKKLNYHSGPQWIAENILKHYKTVIAVSGTHGKTTTTSLVAWILEFAGGEPGFLIGGVPENFGVSARLGKNDFFVIEADEYDSAFFDKRSKFIHYHPDILILNNLEFDHADIFSDLAAIQKQFEFLIRTVPAQGLIIKNNTDQNLTTVLEEACWTAVETFGEENADWSIGKTNAQGSEFEVLYQGKLQGKVSWSLIGKHNQHNALAALSCAYRAGVDIQVALKALEKFKNVKRRMEQLGNINQLKIYSDFAHHPTAIQTTLQGLRAQVGDEKIIVVLECGSNTMRMGVHKNTLPASLKEANKVLFLRPANDWGIEEVSQQCHTQSTVCENVEEIISQLKSLSHSPHHVVLMSNTGFCGLPQKLFS